MIDSKPFFQYFSDKLSEYNTNLFKMNKKFLELTLSEIKNTIKKKTKQDKDLRVKEIEKNFKMIKKIGRKKYIQMINSAASFDINDQKSVDRDIRLFIYSLFGKKFEFVTKTVKEKIINKRIQEKSGNGKKSGSTSMRNSTTFSPSKNDKEILSLGIEMKKMNKGCQIIIQKERENEIKIVDEKKLKLEKILKKPKNILHEEFMEKNEICKKSNINMTELINKIVDFIDEYHIFHEKQKKRTRKINWSNLNYFKMRNFVTDEFIDYLDFLREKDESGEIDMETIYNQILEQIEEEKNKKKKLPVMGDDFDDLSELDFGGDSFELGMSRSPRNGNVKRIRPSYRGLEIQRDEFDDFSDNNFDDDFDDNGFSDDVDFGTERNDDGQNVDDGGKGSDGLGDPFGGRVEVKPVFQFQGNFMERGDKGKGVSLDSEEF